MCSIYWSFCQSPNSTVGEKLSSVTLPFHATLPTPPPMSTSDLFWSLAADGHIAPLQRFNQSIERQGSSEYLLLHGDRMEEKCFFPVVVLSCKRQDE